MLGFGASCVSAAPDASPLGQHPAQTPAEKELEAMLRKPDKDIDLALANYLIVADLPPFKNLSRSQFLGLVDASANKVKGLLDQARRNPFLMSNPNTPASQAFAFCSAVIALGVDYKEEFKVRTEGAADVTPLYRDANNIFLAGLLQTKRGSCVSLPLLYLVIGERLGLPVHLVNIGQHSFIRWEQPGYRMNIETTITKKVAMTPNEDIYLETERLTRDQLKGTDDLKNMSKRDVIGALFYARCGWYRVQGPQYQREFLRDLNRAHYLLPKSRNVTLFWQEVKRQEENDQEINRRRQQMREETNPRLRIDPTTGGVEPWIPSPQPAMPEIPRPQVPIPLSY